MLTDPSGKPYRPNEEQREALQAEFHRTNVAKTKAGRSLIELARKFVADQQRAA